MAKTKGKKRRSSAYGDRVKYSPNSFVEHTQKPAGASGDNAVAEKTRQQDSIREQENERLRREALQRQQEKEKPNFIREAFAKDNAREGIRLYRMKMRRQDMALSAKKELERGLGRKLSRQTIEDDIANVSSTTKADVYKDVIGDYREQLKDRMNDPIFDINHDGKVDETEWTPGMRSIAKYM